MWFPGSNPGVGKRANRKIVRPFDVADVAMLIVLAGKLLPQTARDLAQIIPPVSDFTLFLAILTKSSCPLIVKIRLHVPR